MERNHHPRGDRLGLAALASAMVGGLLLAAGFVVAVPALVLAIGGLLFLAGVVLAFFAARRDGDNGFRTAWRFFLDLLP